MTTPPRPALFSRPFYDDWIVRTYLALGLLATCAQLYSAWHDTQIAQRYGERPAGPAPILAALVLTWTVWSVPVLWLPAFIRRAVRIRRAKASPAAG
jgi:hypothetical protein